MVLDKSKTKEPSEEFIMDLYAQLNCAIEDYLWIRNEVENSQVGQELNHECRNKTKSFINNIKYLLDQITVKVWEILVDQTLNENVVRTKPKKIYYLYSNIEKQLSDMKLNADCPDHMAFASWARGVSPEYTQHYSSLRSICKLSKLSHTKLIKQTKNRTFIVEAYSKDGGGTTLFFEDKPQKFQTYTYSSKYGAASGFGFPSLPNNDPEGKLEIFEFDPETMDFLNPPPGARTSIKEGMQCKLEDMDFEALTLFADAICATKDILYKSLHII